MSVLTSRDEILRIVQDTVIGREDYCPAVAADCSVEEREELAQLPVEPEKIVELLAAQRPKTVADAVCRRQRDVQEIRRIVTAEVQRSDHVLGHLDRCSVEVR